MEVCKVLMALSLGSWLSPPASWAGLTEDRVSHGEHCQHEQFEAKCPHHHIIIIERAVYGRMRLGRCVKHDYGFIGCFVDVTETLDAACSGLRRCEMAVTEPNFAKTGTPCNVEFINYLEVTYKCVEVAALSANSCTLGLPANGHVKSGVLPSSLSRERSCGSQMKPWKIQVASGQRINVTMLDFGTAAAADAGGGATRSHNDVSNVRYKYGSVEEADIQASYDISGSPARVSHVYTSVGHRLNIVFNHNPGSHFILLYEAVGCPNYLETPSTWLKATAPNTLLVGCKNNDSVWQLVCRDTRWIGFVGNCSQDGGLAGKPPKSNGERSRILPAGLTIGVILGVAITISLCIVIVGLICLRRSVRLRQNRRRCRKESILMKPSVPATSNSNVTVSERIYNPSCYLESDDTLLESLSQRDPYYSCRSEYSTSSWNHHRHPPLERPNCHYAPGYCARSVPSATAGLDLVQTEPLYHKRECSRSVELSASRDGHTGSKDCLRAKDCSRSRDCGSSIVLLDTAQSDL